MFWLTYFGLLLGGQLLNAFQTYWLGLWARAYDGKAEVDVVYWLGMYFVWVLAGVLASSIAAIIFYLGAVRVCRSIHKKLVDSIFAAYTRFLDITPVGRIVSRFTKDMKSIDGNFTETFESVADVSLGLLVKFFAVVTVVPFFSIPAIVSRLTSKLTIAHRRRRRHPGRAVHPWPAVRQEGDVERQVAPVFALCRRRQRHRLDPRVRRARQAPRRGPAQGRQVHPDRDGILQPEPMGDGPDRHARRPLCRSSRCFSGVWPEEGFQLGRFRPEPSDRV